GAIIAAAGAAVAAYDEGQSLDAHAMRLARRLQRAGRLDGAALGRMIGDGVLPLFIAGLAMLCGLDAAGTWEVLSDPEGRGPALLLRAARLPREDVAAILLSLNERGPLLSGAEGAAAAAQLELYDTIDEATAREILRLWQANPAYRASIARLSTRSRASAAEAA
ncbi:MAG TPA: DUF2336 domain-containing protein, partial [Allosphingosinicella sp.]|nr:DUF2336 domain-containing protein [Allosphingosinicella sp.]